MSVRPKPKIVEDFILGGALERTVEVVAPVEKSLHSVKLLVDPDLLESRHQWILEAIYDKLEQQEQQKQIHSISQK